MQAETGTTLTDAARPAVARTRAWLVGLVAVVAAVVDQATKAVALENLELGVSVDVFGDALSWTLVMNSGAAFGLAQGQTILITALAIGVVVLILRLARRLSSIRWAVALGLILGGAVGNLVDRLFREPGPFRGEVVDFIDVGFWPVFNVADIAVVSGALAVALLTVLGVPAEHDPDVAATR